MGADEILFLKDGQIVERGNHESLMSHNGRYRQLYDVQAGGSDKHKTVSS
jgi:ATP-binding cassette subfamily B protein